MNQRHNQLLCGLVERHIATGSPVSSRELTGYLRLTISPATVRHDLQELTEAGYLEQPHTSAGRVPTDQGYRHYVDQIHALNLKAAERQRVNQAYARLFTQYQAWSRATARLLAELSHNVAVTANLPTDFQEAGMSELLAVLEPAELNTAREVSQLIESLHEQAENFNSDQETQVYIGRENPFLSAEHTSAIVRKTTQPDGSITLLVITGPKRMSYERNLALMNYVANLPQTL